MQLAKLLARIPKWVWAAAAFAVFLTFVFLIRDWRDRIRKQAVLEQTIKQLETRALIAEVALRTERVKTDSIVYVTITKTVPAYDSARVKVDTAAVADTARTELIPPGHVVVPIEFVRAADETKNALLQLEARIRVERIAADSLDVLRVAEIQALKDLNQVQRGGGVLSTLTKTGIGVGIGVLVTLLLK